VVGNEDGCFSSFQSQKYRFFEGKVLISCPQWRHYWNDGSTHPRTTHVLGACAISTPGARGVPLEMVIFLSVNTKISEFGGKLLKFRAPIEGLTERRVNLSKDTVWPFLSCILKGYGPGG
jgi:hypothetical protein